MQDFLNPKSMVTPGAAGAILMFLVNGLSVPFPEMPARYVALALSFLIGAVVFKAARMKVVERVVYWLLNSLVIFVVGFGANNIGREATTKPVALSFGKPTSPFTLLVSSAYATEEAKPAPAAKPKPKGAAGEAAAAAQTPDEKEQAKLKSELEAQRQQLEALRRENEVLRQSKQGTSQADKSFFRKW